MFSTISITFVLFCLTVTLVYAYNKFFMMIFTIYFYLLYCRIEFILYMFSSLGIFLINNSIDRFTSHVLQLNNSHHVTSGLGWLHVAHTFKDSSESGAQTTS